MYQRFIIFSIWHQHEFNYNCLKCGYSPLHAAAFCGHQSIVEELISSGSNPDSKDKVFNFFLITQKFIKFIDVSESS